MNLNTNRIKLRNKIMAALEGWRDRLNVSDIRCEPQTDVNKLRKYHHRIVRAIGKGGRAIAIYPILGRNEMIPRPIWEELERLEAAGAIVGCAEGLGDVWDIAINDPLEYSRKAKTYAYQYWARLYRKKKESTNGAREQEPKLSR